MHAKSRGFHFVATAVFALVALLQAARAVLEVPVRIDAFAVPPAASAAVALACAALAAWGWRTR